MVNNDRELLEQYIGITMFLGCIVATVFAIICMTVIGLNGLAQQQTYSNYIQQEISQKQSR